MTKTKTDNSKRYKIIPPYVPSWDGKVSKNFGYYTVSQVPSSLHMGVWCSG